MVESDAAQSAIASIKNSTHGAISLSMLVLEVVAIPVAKKLGETIFKLIKDLSHSGNTTVKKLLDSKRKIALFAIKEEDYKKFEYAAKKRGITFAAIKDKNTKKDGYVEIMALEDQASIIDHIIDTNHLATIDTEQFQKVMNEEKEKAPDQEVNKEKVDSLLQKHVTQERIKMLANEIEARENGLEHLNDLYKDYTLPELKEAYTKIETLNLTCKLVFNQTKEYLDKIMENNSKEEEKGNPPLTNENQLSNNSKSTKKESKVELVNSEEKLDDIDTIPVNKTTLDDYEITTYEGTDLTINKDVVISSDVIKKDIEEKFADVKETNVGDYKIISFEGDDLEKTNEIIKDVSLESPSHQNPLEDKTAIEDVGLEESVYPNALENIPVVKEVTVVKGVTLKSDEPIKTKKASVFDKLESFKGNKDKSKNVPTKKKTVIKGD